MTGDTTTLRGLAGQAVQHLNRDRIMARLVSDYGVPSLGPRPYFQVLSRSVVSQQISAKAARTVLARLRASPGLTPEAVLATDICLLRRQGLPPRKAACLLELAGRALRGSFDHLCSLSDDKVVGELTAIGGIGKWTAQMFLIFGLGRPDIWPSSDLGIRVAARGLFNATDKLEIARLSDRFRPFRSYAAWYLWVSLENSRSPRAKV